MNSYGLDPDSLRTLLKIVKTHAPAAEVVLFGSRAKGNFREGSDIDLALKGTGLTPDTISRIQMDYDDAYLPWKLDVVIYETLNNPALKEHIDRVGVVLSFTQ